MTRSKTPRMVWTSTAAATSSICSSRARRPIPGRTSPPPTWAPRRRSRWTRRWSAHRRSARRYRGPHPDHRKLHPGPGRELANVLKYGSLPLSFESSEAETVSATLGLTSLRAGLIAGAIGLVLVLVYSLLYYRVLGLLTALSLVASGAMVFAILVLLGRYINYTLDLAGIAGLIIGIGTTADSFVVFFERIKDEIREGRSFRSAVPAAGHGPARRSCRVTR
ncbi:export membrane family protein [Mycobacterium xenopi 4042]|uniref:Export membrane family protein n=1 Tax=Mycobacterium xenopi 4042 TaxID=1299334 RepID=X8DIH4_MYCXE|nr:export membrane family protein [Mycobacterium xenopi 4042]